MISEEFIRKIEHENLSSEDIGYLLDHLCRLGIQSRPEVAPKVVMFLKSRKTLDHVTREEVAKYLHMSSRTLSRKLKKENCGFHELLNGERKRRCRYYLSCNIVCGNELVELLGLSDISHFYKSFKMWTGYGFAEAKAMMAENNQNIDAIFRRQ